MNTHTGASNVIPLDKALSRGFLPSLETFPTPYQSSQIGTGLIRIIFPEFTCVCPRTGYPDFATIILCYLPGRLCLELKSWKLYLNSFRMVGAFHEAVTWHLFRTLQTTLRPRWLLVAGDFLPRGNVDTTVVFESKGPRPRGTDFLVECLRPRCRQLA